LAVAEQPVVVERLSKSFGEVKAVDDIAFAVEPGSITALLGGNGAGKTTTIAMLLGLIVPTRGRVRVFGVDMSRERHEVLHRLNFGSPYVEMPMRLTVRQNLTVFAMLYGVRDPERRIDRLARDLRLQEFLDKRTGQLSAGQKTRVALAKALLNEPELLLLDEPTASLDPDTADWVRQQLLAFRRASGATLILASHNMQEVERMADRVIMLHRGRIVEDAPPAELIARHGRESLEQVFLDIARRERH
jgi:ABC-2 type transport system ATP-binding protein